MCVSAISHVFLSALSASCEGTNPCLCGWLHSDTSRPQVSSVWQSAKALDSPLSHCCDYSRWPTTGLTDTDILTLTPFVCVVCVCVWERGLSSGKQSTCCFEWSENWQMGNILPFFNKGLVRVLLVVGIFRRLFVHRNLARRFIFFIFCIWDPNYQIFSSSW